jgi:hypothetical protein
VKRLDQLVEFGRLLSEVPPDVRYFARMTTIDDSAVPWVSPRRKSNMKIKVTLIDVNGNFVAEVRAPALTSWGTAIPTPKVIVWRERAFIALPVMDQAVQHPRVYREAETYKAAHRPVR